eukprot:355158-Chlamydomonas_euryale.AAC.3
MTLYMQHQRCSNRIRGICAFLSRSTSLNDDSTNTFRKTASSETHPRTKCALRLAHEEREKPYMGRPGASLAASRRQSTQASGIFKVGWARGAPHLLRRLE